MANIKKHVANFADHERVDAYNNLTNAMEHVSALFDSLELIACDMSDEATNARFELYGKLEHYLDSVATFAYTLGDCATRACVTYRGEAEAQQKRAETKNK